MYEAEPELTVRGQWICLNIQPGLTWPTRSQSLEFAGHRIWIIPITREEYGGVGMKIPDGMNAEEGEGILLRFLSVLSWRERSGILVAHRTGGDIVRMMGRPKLFADAIQQAFDFTDFPCPNGDGAIALGLMREARSLNHPGYSFLSYWRILELAFRHLGKKASEARVRWMKKTLPILNGDGVREAKASIAAEGIEGTAEVCRHLFESSRCAVAHANSEIIVNPDDPRDARRLTVELPLVREMAIQLLEWPFPEPAAVREMAIQAIEEIFGIPSRSTEFRLHLYELKGWKQIIGDDVIKRYLAGEMEEGEMVYLPNINVRLRENPVYPSFENMVAIDLFEQDQRLFVEYQSQSGLALLRFALNFPEERLEFEITDGIFGGDDGSVLAAEHRHDADRFIRDYLLNGELQMWDAETGALLSRLDAFLPRNCFVELDACNARIDAALNEVNRRKEASEKTD